MADNERYATVELRLKDYISGSMPKIRKEFQALTSEMVKNEVNTVKVGIAQQKLEAASNRTASTQKRLEVSTLQVSSAQKRLEVSSTQTAIAQKRLEIAVSQADAAQKRAEIAALRLEKAHNKQSSSFAVLAGAISQLRTATIAYIAVRAVEHIYGESVALDSLQYKVKAAVKGYADAGETMSWVSDEADRIGLRTRTAAEGFSSFAAAATRSNISMEDTKRIWTDIAETATAMRLPAMKVEMVFKAIEQMASKGKISTEELRQQLGEHLPGAFGIAAKSMGMTTQAFDKALSSGEVYAQDFLPKFSRAIREELGGEFETASKGVVANAERMKDRFDAIYRILGDNLLPSFNNLLGWLAKSDGAFARSTEFVGKYANRLGKLMGGTSFDVVKTSESNQELIDMASKVSRPYAERMLKGAKFGIDTDISATAEAIKNLEKAPSFVTPGGNGIDQKAAQMERLKKRMEDLTSESIILSDALENIGKPKTTFSDGVSGSSGDKKGSKNRLEDQLVKSSFRYADAEYGPGTEFEVDRAKYLKVEQDKEIAVRRAFDQSKLKLIIDARDREVEELRLQQKIEIEDFKGTEEQKKLILRTQENEMTAIVRDQSQERIELNKRVATSAYDAAETIGNLAFDTLLGNIDMKKEKERAHALTAAQFGLAHGMAAAKIWTTAKNWQEGLAESIGVSAGLFAQEISAHVNINKYARGTEYSRGGRSIVGEREPEVIDLPPGSRVTPLSKMQPQQPPVQVINHFYDHSGTLAKSLFTELRNNDGQRLMDYMVDQVKRSR
jgi:tape measure domain-containing protein